MSTLSYPVTSSGAESEIMYKLLNDAKLGILCGTIASALFGSLILNKTLPKASA